MPDERPLSDLTGLSPEARQKLAQMGIRSADAFIARAMGPHGALLARQLGVDARQLTSWAAKADLAKMASTSKELARVLGAAGLEAGKGLQERIPPGAQAKLSDLAGNLAKSDLAKRAPSRDQIGSFLGGITKKRDP